MQHVYDPDAELAELAADADALRSTLEQIAAATPDWPASSPRYYRSAAALVLARGETWRGQQRPADSVIRFPQTTPTACFSNAAALAARAQLDYVEGYGLTAGVPIHHAWCVGRRGSVQADQVYDPTWDWSRRQLRGGGSALVGVRIPLGALFAALGVDGGMPVLDAWQRGWPILRSEYRPESADYVRDLVRAIEQGVR
jgi:hypothetical protein